MGKLSKYLFSLFTAMILIGCSNDVVNPDDNKQIIHQDGNVYVQVTIKTPTVSSSTRSETGNPNGNYSTSTGGTEIGSEDENRIFNVMLILAGKDNEFISYALVGGLADKNDNLSGTPTNNSVTITTSFDREAIDKFYDKKTADNPDFDPTNVKVYVFCNYTQDMLNYISDGATVPFFSKDWVNLSQKVIEYSPTSGEPNTGASVLSTGGGLFMSNAVIANKKFPEKADDWDEFTNEDNPFALSGTVTINKESGTTPETIDNSGAIRVERGMARFDFADGSPGDNTYILGTKADESDQEESSGQQTKEEKKTLLVKLVRMCLVNMSNDFYCLRHMAPNSTVDENMQADPTKMELCVAETPWDDPTKPGNWVVGPNYAWKIGYSNLNIAQQETAPYSDYFNFPLGNDPADNKWGITPEARLYWYTSKISEVLDGKDDNSQWKNPNGTTLDYKVWRYVTENTIPSVASQKNGISTGIVFKGLLLPTDDTPKALAAALNGTYRIDSNGEFTENETGKLTHPNLYVFDDVMYVSWKEVREDAFEQKVGSPLFNAVFGNSTIDADGKTFVKYDNECADALYTAWQNDPETKDKFTGEKYDAFRTSIVSSNFAIYQHSSEDAIDDGDSDDTTGQGGYFCYYYYWNRHNDNGRNGKRGPMEFQVVRNNVYKIAVTEIKKVGHPRRTQNDPDPITPGTDDEESKVYFSVNVEVLPWTVRVNNVNF